jgi:hypothetical protein
MNWNNISLYQFREVERINSDPKLDELDKLLFTTCSVFKITEYQLDTMPPKKAGKLIGKVEKIFSSDFKPRPFKRLGIYIIEYNISNLTFGQYVELSYFLQGNVIQNAHYILASITHLPLLKNNTAKHRDKAENFLTYPITKTLGSVTLFIEKFTAFNKEYKSLFGLSEQRSEVQTDIFNKNFGWQFSAREVANDLRITLDEAYRLPIREALNCLSYLKAKGQYEERQMKNQNNQQHAR